MERCYMAACKYILHVDLQPLCDDVKGKFINYI